MAIGAETVRHAAIPALVEGPRGLITRLRSHLPVGGGLPDATWGGRHRGILLLLWAHAAFIPAFGLIRGYEPMHVVLESVPVPALAAIATWSGLSRQWRTFVTSLGLLTCSAILVHLSGGTIEMHFHFFVMVGVVSLYQDWIPFLASIGYVLIHHGLAGALDPDSVYNHYAAINGPWKWAAIHAFFIAGSSTAALVNWRLSERMVQQRDELFAAESDARASAEESARRLAVLAEENAQLYAQQRSVAETLQHSFLPERLPKLPGIECGAIYMAGGPGVDVGGDWYDVIQLTGGRLGIAIGDVVGRGERAASLMGQLRNALRAYALDGKEPGELVNALNLLITDTGAEHMATMVYGVLDPAKNRFVYANAGHPPVLCLRASGEAEFLEARGGLPLGAVAGNWYEETSFEISGGDTVLLYTDGLVEERTRAIDVGLERLKESARVGTSPDLQQFCADLADRVLDGRPCNDDMAILAVRLEALGERLTMRLPSEPSVLGALRATLRRWLASVGASEQETFELLVACGEAATNAIRHAGGVTGSEFEVEAEVNGDVRLTVRDHGQWRESRGAIGGRGLPIIESYVDGVEVDKGENGTEIRMRRRLASQEVNLSNA